MTTRSTITIVTGPRLMLVVAFLAIAVATGTRAEPSCTAALTGGTLEPGGGSGALRLGMVGDEVLALIGPPERSEGAPWEYPSCGFAIMFRDGELAAILGGDGTGGGPELAERFTIRTLEGVGIGSTREELVAAMGDPSEQGGTEPMPTRIEVPQSEIIYYPGVTWTLRGGRVDHVTIQPPRASMPD